MKAIRQILIAWMIVAFLVLQGFGKDVKLPPPRESQHVDWTVFTYNSPEEKAFWDELPDWSGKILVRGCDSNPFILWPDKFRRNAQGEIIESNSSEGFNGNVKHGKAYFRTIYQFVDGYAVRSKSWVEDGYKWKELNYKEGKQDGLETVWYGNGQKKSETNYKDGGKDGLETVWDGNGQKKSETNYKDGGKDGLETVWYGNGQKKSETNYKDGVKDGLETVWDGNGQKKSETNYKDRRKDGLETSWYEDGRKKSETNYKDGELHGLRIEWNQKFSPTDRLERYYKDGKLHGFSISWHRNGHKYVEENYKDGKQDGLQTRWDENGQKLFEENYKGGKLTYAKVWLPDGKKCPESKVIDGNGTLVSYSFSGKEKTRKNIINGRIILPSKPKRVVTFKPVVVTNRPKRVATSESNSTTPPVYIPPRVKISPPPRPPLSKPRF